MYQFSYQYHLLLLVNVHMANLVVITMKEDKKNIHIIHLIDEYGYMFWENVFGAFESSSTSLFSLYFK